MANPTVTIEIKEIGAKQVIDRMKLLRQEAGKLVGAKKRLSRRVKETGSSFKKSAKNARGLGTEMRNLGSAAVFAVGPLSGVGARLVAFQAIASRTTIAVAAFLAAFATIAVISFKVIAAMGRTAIEVNKMMNALKAATGSAAGARREFQFLVDTSRELSLDLSSVGIQFAQLAAAARGTSLAGKGVRDIFKAVSTAALVLGLSSEQTTGALRALQQMISKGTVQAEELRGQLGERIPGAFQIAARAIGVTTRELGKMLEQGLVIAEELLPLMAVELEKTFSPQVEEAVEQIGAAIQGLKTEFFLFFKLLEDNVGLVQGFAGFLRTMGRGVRVINEALGKGGLQGALKEVNKEISDNDKAIERVTKLLKSAEGAYLSTTGNVKKYKDELLRLTFVGIRLTAQQRDLQNQINSQGDIFGPPAPTLTFEQLRNLPVSAVDKFKESLQDMRVILKSLADPSLSLEDKLGLVSTFEKTQKAAEKASKVLKSLSGDELAALRTRVDGTQRSMEEVRNTLIKLITTFMEVKETVSETTKALERQDAALQKVLDNIESILVEADAIDRLKEATRNGEAAREKMLFQLEFESELRRNNISALSSEGIALLAAMQLRQSAIEVEEQLANAMERSFNAIKRLEKARDKVENLKKRGQAEIESIEKANEVLKLRIDGLEDEADLMELRNLLEEKYAGKHLEDTRKALEKIILENDRLAKKLEEVDEFRLAISDGFRQMGSDLAGAIREGKSIVDVLINSFGNLVERLLEVAIQLLIIGPLLKALQLPGGAAGPTSLFGIPTNILGLAHGADFTVRGKGGTDTNLVPLALTAGERVQVTPAGGDSSEKMTVINFNFPPGTNVREFRDSEGQLAATVAGVLSSASQSNA